MEYDDARPLQFHQDTAGESKSIRMGRKKFIGLMLLGAGLALLLGILIGYSTKPSNTSPPEQHSDETTSKINVTKFLFDNMKASNIQENLSTSYRIVFFVGQNAVSVSVRKSRYLTINWVLSAEVHIAGSRREEEFLVDFLVDKWQKQLDDVKVYPYDVMLSFPNDTDPNYVAVMDTSGKVFDKSTAFEPPLDKSENFSSIQSTFNGYGAAGHVQGDLVYVNYGREEDFRDLASTLKVDVKGKICIARYGRTFRGQKAEYAEKYGCIGLIMYTDPADYADRNNPKTPTYPKTWWMPPTGVQRGTLDVRGGDPTTPFYPSIKSAYRVPENETGLITIPVQPISSSDAYKYLSRLGGPAAPDNWKGGLNITYRLGGEMLPEYSNQSIVLHVANYKPIKTAKNVIGYIWGSEEPDRYVVIGNHRDAWVFGAVDPSSGTAVMMEVVGAFGELVNSGNWRPRRTIVFCSWGAEEYGLIGSSEWVEQFEKKLLLQAVSYVNIDIAVQGNFSFRAKAMPNLHRLLFDVTKMIPNPDPHEVALGRPFVYDTWKFKNADKTDKTLPYVGALGSGSDYALLVQRTGISSVDMRYTFDEENLKLSSYPIYHSAHETIKYFETFLDPEYKFSLATAQIWTELTRRIADSAVIPFDPLKYAQTIKGMISKISKEYKVKLKEKGIELDYLQEAADSLVSSATKLNETIGSINQSNALDVRRLNDKLMYLDRAFLDFNGLPGRKYFRHIVYAPSMRNTYLGTGFSSLVDSIPDAEEDNNWEPVKKQLSITTYHLLSASGVLVQF